MKRNERRQAVVSLFALMGRAAHAQGALLQNEAMLAKGVITPGFDREAAREAYEQATESALDALDTLIQSTERRTNGSKKTQGH